MKVLVLLEFGIPPYRDFLFRYLSCQKGISKFLVVHTGQKFKDREVDYPTKKVETVDVYNFSIHRNILSLINEFDVIITSFNIYRPLCWLPMLWKNKKWILWGSGIGSNKWSRLNRFIRMPFINRSSRFIVYTKSAKNELQNIWGVDSTKIAVANNTLYVSNSGVSQATRRYLLYVGRVQQRKGLLNVLEAIQKLKKECSLNVPFVIVGDGDYKKVLKEYVKKNCLEKLVSFYPGTFDEEKLKYYFESALCYVSPNKVGLGVVHAFSYGIPVLTRIAEDHGREFSYCSEDNSFLYETHDMLPIMIKEIVQNPELSYKKGRHGFYYYRDHLDHTHMNQIFLDAIGSYGN